jgi:lysozyme
MRTSAVGLLKISVREGRRKKAYKDTKGIWTIGVGHTGPEVKEGLTISDAEIDRLLEEDIKWAEAAVNAVKAPLNQNMFDALVSFVFNIGATAFANSTMKKLLDVGDYKGAYEQFDRWVIPKEITGRRMQEKAQFITPV